MRAAMAAARALLARRAGVDTDAVPLRLDAGHGALVSALPRRIAPRRGVRPEVLAELWAASAQPGEPFAGITARAGMLVLPLSRRWLRSVLERYAQADWPQGEPPAGVRQCDRDSDAFLLDYTARRCRALSARGELLSELPRSLVCLLAEDAPDALAVARAFWALPPEGRRDGALVRAVGTCAARGAFLQKIHPPLPPGDYDRGIMGSGWAAVTENEGLL